MLTRALNRMEDTTSTTYALDKTLGKRVKSKRVLAGLSQEQLAQKLRVSINDIASYEIGATRISAAHLFELAKALDVPPVYFFDGAEKPRHGSGFQEEVSRVREGGLTLQDQGVRLNRAFVGVRNSNLREAIIRFVTEMGRGEEAR